MRRKVDDDAIAAFLDQLAAEPWLDSGRRAWPAYLFHLTDVRNVPSIAAADRLLCRSGAEAAGVMESDNASPRIIAQTSQTIHDQVRLYFRPRTPTFFHNEGIRPAGQRSHDAHCPVPVAFLFDAKHVLGMVGTRFSDGNLASSRAVIGSDAAFLRRMPFQMIYHNRAFASEDREIIFRRQAEVIVPGELSLQGLRHIYVRSIAEFETLQSLLMRDQRVTIAAYDRLLALVRVNSRSSLFHNRWTYVERVDLIGSLVRVTFNPSTNTPGPFKAEFMWEEVASSRTTNETVPALMARGPHWQPIPPPVRAKHLRFTLRLDDCLAYTGDLDPASSDDLLDIPF